MTANADPTPAATVRAIDVAHTVAQNFGDIGYHLLVDQHGGVSEGPLVRTRSGARVRPRGGRPLMCNAAHVGRLIQRGPTVRDRAARRPDLRPAHRPPGRRSSACSPGCARSPGRPALPAVLAPIVQASLGSVHYVNPISGATRDVDAIAGHRDWLATECPGTPSTPTLPELRREVAALLRPAPARGGLSDAPTRLRRPLGGAAPGRRVRRAGQTPGDVGAGPRRERGRRVRLRMAGLGPGDRCAVLARNAIEYPLLQVAARAPGWCSCRSTR